MPEKNENGMENREDLFEEFGLTEESEKTAPDFGSFIKGTGVNAEPKNEEAAEAPAEDDINYMASMQNMFASLKNSNFGSGNENTEEEDEEAAEITKEAAEELFKDETDDKGPRPAYITSEDVSDDRSSVEEAPAPAAAKPSDEPSPFRNAPAVTAQPEEPTPQKGADSEQGSSEPETRKMKGFFHNVGPKAVAEPEPENEPEPELEEPEEAPEEEAPKSHFHLNLPIQPKTTVLDVEEEIEPAEEEPGVVKDDAYWSKLDDLLNNFDDGEVHAEVFKPSYSKKDFEGDSSSRPSRSVRKAENLLERFVDDSDPEEFTEPVPEEEVIYNEEPAEPSRLERRRAAAAVMAGEESAAAGTGYFMNRPAGGSHPRQPVEHYKTAEEKEMERRFREQRAYERGEKYIAPDRNEEPEPPVFEPTPKKGKKEKKKKDKKKGKVFPSKGDSVGEVIRKMVVIISALVLLGCAIYFCYTFIQSKRNESTNTNISSLLKTDATDADWKAVRKKYPNVEFPEGMQIKFADVYALNQDLVGWVNIKGLEISYPILQGATDDTYLRHNFNKEYSVYGAPFLSSKNRVKAPLDENSVIYGHSMRRDDQMFTPLKAYKTVDGFKKNPIIEYDTLYNNYKFKVAAVFITNGDASGDNGYLFDYTFLNLASKKSFDGYVKQLKERSLYSTGVDIKYSDKMLVLSTCTYEFEDARLVIIGRMVR